MSGLHDSSDVSVKSAPDYVVAMMTKDFRKGTTESISSVLFSRKALISLVILLAIAATSAGLYILRNRDSHRSSPTLTNASGLENNYLPHGFPQISNQTSPPNVGPVTGPFNASAPSARFCWFLCWSPSYPPSSPPSPPPPAPSPCSSGSYSSTGNTPCSQCPAGSYCSSGGLTAPTGVCRAGSYSSGGAASCTTCPAGSHCSTDGLSLPDGACAAGTFSASGASSCTPCSEGQMQPLSGQSHCVPCPAGSFCSSNGLSAPDGVNDYCPKGSFAQSGAISVLFSCMILSCCSPCPPGQMQPLSGQSSCTACPAGSHCWTEGLSAPTGDCSAGSYSSGGAASASCTDCPAGSFCPHSAMRAATPCPQGSFCPSARLTAATPCTPGMYCAGTGLAAVSGSCAAGSYSSGGAATSACMPCPDGMYQDAAGQASCSPCPAGAFCVKISNQMQGVPSTRLNYLSHSDGYIYSTLADVPKSSVTLGLIHQDSWLRLPSGWELAPDNPDARAAATAFTWSSHAVVLATGFGVHAGIGDACTYTSGSILEQNGVYYRPRNVGAEFNVFIRAKSQANINTWSHFVDCAVGTYQNATGQSSCKTCPPGSACPSTGMTFPSPCTVGTSQDLSGQSACTICPAGSYCSSGGLTAPTGVCRAGSYSSGGAASCTTCPAGSHCSTDGLSLPDGACAAGTFSASGASSCTPCSEGQMQPLSGQSHCVPEGLDFMLSGGVIAGTVLGCILCIAIAVAVTKLYFQEAAAAVTCNVKTLFHATTPFNADCILKHGFLCGSGGLAGGGIYFAETEADANRKAHRSGAMLKCVVDLGKQLHIPFEGDPLARKKMRDGGFHTVIIPRAGTEHVVYDAKRVRHVLRLN
jgi:hypothetical protein